MTKNYYYFAPEGNRLRYRDGREIKVGITHKIPTNIPLELCSYGLHFSERIIDALTYAQTSNLYLVEVKGDVLKGKDKSCAYERYYKKHIDLEEKGILSEFARKQALINISKIKPYCSDEEYTLINEWLITGDPKIRDAASSAVYSAASSAASSAAYSTASSAFSAAYYAASSAAYSTAYSTASSTAHSAAHSTASSTAHSAASSAFSAAYYAAYSAAYSTSRSKQETMLHEMITNKYGEIL